MKTKITSIKKTEKCNINGETKQAYKITFRLINEEKQRYYKNDFYIFLEDTAETIQSEKTKAEKMAKDFIDNNFFTYEDHKELFTKCTESRQIYNNNIIENGNLLEITKVKEIDNYFNSMAGNVYGYQVFFRIYNRRQKPCKYYKGNFAIKFTGEDVAEMNEDPEDYTYTKEDIKQYRDDLIFSFVDTYQPTYNNHKDFFKACYESLENY